MNEFWRMLCDPAHWAFEILATVVFDGLLLGIFWPMIRNGWRAGKIARELGARAAFTMHLADAAYLCNSCGVLPTRLDTSVDMCAGCGDVQIPERKTAKNHDNGVTTK